MIGSSKLLINESPFQFQRTLAAWVGLNESIFLQQLHFLLRDVDSGKKGKIEDGIPWYRNSIDEWRVEFPFWDDGVIKRTIKNLTDDGLIVVKSFSGRCHWFTISYLVLDSLTGPLPRVTGRSAARREARAKRPIKDSPVSVQNVPIRNIGTNCTDTNITVQNVPNISTNCAASKTPIKENLTTTTTRAEFLRSNWDAWQDMLAQSKPALMTTLGQAVVKDKLDVIGQALQDFWGIDLRAARYQRLARDVAQDCRDYSLDAVLWAMLVAQSTDRQNGQNKSWGYIRGILEKEKNQNGHGQNGHGKPKPRRGRSAADIEREEREQAAYAAQIDAALAAASNGAGLRQGVAA